MSGPSRKLQGPLMVTGFGAVLASCSLVVGPSAFARSTLWMAGQITLALVIAGLFGLIATVAARPRTRPYLDQIASRGIELTAALPLVLACGVLTVAAALPAPVAVATVVGIMGGLRCVRVVESVIAAIPTTPPPEQLTRSLQESVGRILLPTASTLIERIVSLEAAIAWLDILEDDWHGGWGQCLGVAARDDDLVRVVAWTLTTIAASAALKLLCWRYRLPEPAPIQTEIRG